MPASWDSVMRNNEFNSVAFNIFLARVYRLRHVQEHRESYQPVLC